MPGTTERLGPQQAHVTHEAGRRDERTTARHPLASTWADLAALDPSALEPLRRLALFIAVARAARPDAGLAESVAVVRTVGAFDRQLSGALARTTPFSMLRWVLRAWARGRGRPRAGEVVFGRWDAAAWLCAELGWFLAPASLESEWRRRRRARLYLAEKMGAILPVVSAVEAAQVRRMPSSRAPNLDAPALRRVAVQASVHPDTVRRFIAGGPTHATTRARIGDALRTLGFIEAMSNGEGEGEKSA